MRMGVPNGIFVAIAVASMAGTAAAKPTHSTPAASGANKLSTNKLNSTKGSSNASLNSNGHSNAIGHSASPNKSNAKNNSLSNAGLHSNSSAHSTLHTSSLHTTQHTTSLHTTSLHTNGHANGLHNSTSNLQNGNGNTPNRGLGNKTTDNGNGNGNGNNNTPTPSPTPSPNNNNNNNNGNGNNNTPNTPNNNNGATLAIISCPSLSSGCLFSGNINTNPTDKWGYTNVQNLYNATYNPDISLNPLEDFSAGGLNPLVSTGITVTVNSSGTGGTFKLAPGIDLDYYAVKAGDYFMLYQYTGGNIGNWTTSGISVGNGQTPNLSHLVFFGSTSTPVPEPATWATMLLGFGAVGAFMRRRKKPAAAPLLA